LLFAAVFLFEANPAVRYIFSARLGWLRYAPPPHLAPKDAATIGARIRNNNLILQIIEKFSVKNQKSLKSTNINIYQFSKAMAFSKKIKKLAEWQN